MVQTYTNNSKEQRKKHFFYNSTTDYTDCTDYLAKATINLDLTDQLRKAISGVSRNNQNESMQSKSV